MISFSIKIATFLLIFLFAATTVWSLFTHQPPLMTLSSLLIMSVFAYSSYADIERYFRR